jgi:hypothetical protein
VEVGLGEGEAGLEGSPEAAAAQKKQRKLQQAGQKQCSTVSNIAKGVGLAEASALR